MEPTELLPVLVKLGKQAKAGSSVRTKIIEAVNDLSSAIAGACSLTALRLNQSLLAERKKQKIAILVSLDEKEIEAHARMNGMCAPISSAARDLQTFYSKLNLHRRMGKKAELVHLLQDLERGEIGLQKLMTDTYSMEWELKGKTKKQIDSYVRSRLKVIEALALSAHKCQFEIGKTI